MNYAPSCVDFLLSLALSMVGTSEAMQISFPNTSHKNAAATAISAAFPLHLASPDSTAIRWDESPSHGRDGDNRMIHGLSKEGTASCAFTTGFWDSLGARSEGQQDEPPSWHAEWASVWIRSKQLTTHYSELRLQSVFEHKMEWESPHNPTCISEEDLDHVREIAQSKA